MTSFNSIIALISRDLKINYRNFYSIFTIFLFFILGVLIFVFSIGPNKELYNELGIGIIWSLILLSNTISLPKFFQSDFNDNSIVIFHNSGISYEIISIIKILIIWLFLQGPFFIIIPFSFILLEIQLINLSTIYISFLIGSVIITCITAISGSMNLLNKKNFSLGSIIVLILSIPVIIFGVNISVTSKEIMFANLNILLGIMFFFLAITPWITATCIKISLQNK